MTKRTSKIIIFSAAAAALLAGGYFYYYSKFVSGPSVEDTPIKDKNVSIDHQELFHNDTKIAFIGSSVTEGTGASKPDKRWTEQFTAVLQEEYPGLESKNFGVDGYSTRNIIEGITDEVVQYKPSFIIFETAALNDFSRLDLQTTLENIATIMETFESELPETHVIIQPSNQRRNGESYTNNGITYPEYVKETESHIKENGWKYIDFWPYFNETYENTNITVSDTLNVDGIHPNDLGNKLWAEALLDYFSGNSLQASGNEEK
ncbi:SGNH/GDSL hydrolase family protein [Alteribacillus sp. JSM 102045]|uniref:SGNH/GDSL hydrolase family protein n=1 Tax=Alteribacillus sp. JSM 102045 TaxID=1562101 RepID=UPI0035C1327A